jgi:hypothetical protein
VGNEVQRLGALVVEGAGRWIQAFAWRRRLLATKLRGRSDLGRGRRSPVITKSCYGIESGGAAPKEGRGDGEVVKGWLAIDGEARFASLRASQGSRCKVGRGLALSLAAQGSE